VFKLLRIKKPSRAHEAQLWDDGFQVVAGVDEVGRGSWAGPVVAAAIVLPATCRLRGVRDSKLLSKLQRQNLVRAIKCQAEAIGLGWSTHWEVDHYGLTEAVRRSGQRALAAIDGVEAVLLDGNHNYLKEDYQAVAIIGADRCCLSVAAASIIAKEARDSYMRAMDRLYPEFGFDSNVGYGTLRHRQRLKSGPSPIHRRRYAPVKLAAGYGN
jgi:ribonuclease HII